MPASDSKRGGGKAGNSASGRLGTGHGGARNSRGRVSYQLTERQCRDLLRAVEVAEALGKPFNRWITITWERNGIEPRDNAGATGRFIKLASDWMRARGHRLVWAWVQEWSDQNGAHVHMLLHVPPALAPLFSPMPNRWVRTVLGRANIARTLRTEKLATGEGEGSDPAAYRAQVKGKTHYMLKCAPAALEAELGMLWQGPKAWGRQCAVFGKRLGIWQGWRAAARLLK